MGFGLRLIADFRRATRFYSIWLSVFLGAAAEIWGLLPDPSRAAIASFVGPWHLIFVMSVLIIMVRCIAQAPTPCPACALAAAEPNQSLPLRKFRLPTQAGNPPVATQEIPVSFLSDVTPILEKAAKTAVTEYVTEKYGTGAAADVQKLLIDVIALAAAPSLSAAMSDLPDVVMAIMDLAAAAGKAPATTSNPAV